MSLAKSPTSLQITVHRHPPELIAPAKPTPHEFKQLSDLDGRYAATDNIPGVLFYPPNPSMKWDDPVQVIRKAVSEALVFYYPFAGRLRESPSGKLVVECNGEGVLFVEADADVTLDQFGSPLAPPFPCLSQLLLEFAGPSEVLNSPLELIQVTRLKCGGFILGVCHSHVICDGFGQFQFLLAVGEIARGATSPSVIPVWERHALSFKNLLQFTSPVPQPNKGKIKIAKDKNSSHETDLCYRTFFFEPSDIAALQRQIPPHFPRCSLFEIVNACIWKCRVVALQPLPEEEMSLIWTVNLRAGRHRQLIPSGYYGNAVLIAKVISTAKEIMDNPLTYILELMRNAEPKVSREYGQSVTNVNASMSSYKVSDLRHVRFDKVDFGWGEPLFAGPDRCFPVSGFQMPHKTKNGENGVMLPMCLPKQVMERFEEELKDMLKGSSYGADENIVRSKL